MRKLFYESILDFSVRLLAIMGRTNRFGFLMFFFGATRINPSKISPIWCRMTVENFVRIVWRVFKKIDFDAIAHAWCRMTVQNFMKLVWTFLRNLKFSLKGQEKKTTRLHSVENFFRLLIIPTKTHAFSA